MRASTIRLIAVFALLLLIAANAHWIGAGPDGSPAVAHHPSSTSGTTRTVH